MALVKASNSGQQSSALDLVPCDEPCVGCLVLLANWIPEDGQVPKCSKTKGGLKCPRCEALGKNCLVSP
ncbi:hypothetical protein IMZ48_28420, partial [Candidatus Bathyarchaeota archaeon]|nr:hypothetical protein [Candidatus Bathyarchaeota archaeon]